MQPYRQLRAHDQVGQRQRMRRTAHILLHQTHARSALDVEPAGIEGDALADNGDLRVLLVAPLDPHDARRMAARGGTANGVDHRIFLLQRVALGHRQLGIMTLGNCFGLGLDSGGAHILRRRIHHIADECGCGRLGHGGVDGLDLFCQQYAGAGFILVLLVFLEPVLRGQPAEQGRAGFDAREAVCACGQGLAQLGKAPAGKAFRIGDATNREPAIPIGNDTDLVTPAIELLCLERSPLPGGKRFRPFGEAFGIDEVDGGGVLPAIGLDQFGIVGHA